jgi:acetyl-CoA carboxylase biotin carboxyl carrier protein
MDLEKIRELVKILEDSSLSEIEVIEGNKTIKLSRVMAAQPVMAPQFFATGAAAVEHKGQSAESVASDPYAGKHVVRSPMVGTFYRAPSPTAKPFVEVGSKVKIGEVLCIIEAMKLMNQIEADCSGTIEAILVENASPVEYGTPLFVILPD